MAALVSTTLTEPFSITFAHVGQISMNLLRFRRLKSTWLGLGKHYGLAWHKYVSSQPAWLPPNVDFSRFLYYDATVSCSTYWMLEGYLQGRCEALGQAAIFDAFGVRSGWLWETSSWNVTRSVLFPKSFHKSQLTSLFGVIAIIMICAAFQLFTWTWNILLRTQSDLLHSLLSHGSSATWEACCLTVCTLCFAHKTERGELKTQ